MTAALVPEVRRVIRNTIGDAFHRTVSKFPNREALIFEQRRWTYAELDRAVNRVANALLSLGLSLGDQVAAYGKNSDAQAILRLACVRVSWTEKW
jgi:fatty-acyl-CoA synthase